MHMTRPAAGEDQRERSGYLGYVMVTCHVYCIPIP